MSHTNKQLVAQARQKWINTMTRSYPGFNPKKWDKNSTYRSQHPQSVL